MTVAQTWWFPLGSTPGLRPVLFFPPSGAEPSVARPLAAHAAGLELGVLQLPGRGTRHDEPAPTEVTEVVGEIADAVQALAGPAPVLVGHSFGGLLAYGVAVALEERGVRIGRLVAVASASPRSWHDELAADRRDHPGEGREDFARRRTERILREGGTPTEILDHPELVARTRELVTVDAALAFDGFPLRTLEAPVTSVVARDDRVLDAAACEAWAEVSRSGHLRIDVPGGHFFYRDRPERLVTGLRLDVATLDGQYDTFA